MNSQSVFFHQALLSALAVLLASNVAGAQSDVFRELRRMVPRSPAVRGEVHLVDWEGDGDLDAFMLERRALLFSNDATGLFDLAPVQPPPGSLAGANSCVEFGDLDGDGDFDAYVAMWAPPGPEAERDRVFMNQGSGSFSSAWGLATGATSDIALGDVDADGDLDVVCANVGQNPFVNPANVLLLNDGSGVFSLGAQGLPGSTASSYAVELGDLDGDGDLDGWVGNNGADSLYVGDGAGGFSAGAVPPSSNDLTFVVALGDVDGDGDLDVLTGRGGSDALYLNDGTGGFASVVALLPAEPATTRDIELVDVDGDGDLDALLARSDARLPSRLLVNDGSGGFADAGGFPDEPGRTGASAAGDVDGDNDVDFLLKDSFGRNQLFLNDGTGRFVDVTEPLGLRSTETFAVLLVDLEGDGDLDLVEGYADYSTGRDHRVFENDGLGRFTERWRLAGRPGARAEAIRAGDVDGDGDQDLLIGNQRGYAGEPQEEANQLFLRDGAKFVDASRQLPGEPDETTDIALVDVDADGDLDAVLGRAGPAPKWPSAVLWRNDGAGVFTEEPSALPFVPFIWAVAPGDVDQDGDVDLLMGAFGSGLGFTTRLLVNDGTGHFTDATGDLPPDPDTCGGLALGDLDGDGDLDVFLTNTTRIWSNDGAGHFTETELAEPSRGPVFLVDVDLDGDLDAITRQVGFLNLGAGAFQPLPLVDNGFGDLRFALGDLDGDRDADLLLAGSETRVWSNLHRQLAWRAVPRIGYPLTMEVFGTPGATWLLACGTAQAEIPLAIGTLRLPPLALRIVDAGLLDGTGRAAHVTTVPADVTLAGQSFFWQALVTAPLGFTNLEQTVLADL